MLDLKNSNTLLHEELEAMRALKDEYTSALTAAQVALTNSQFALDNKRELLVAPVVSRAVYTSAELRSSE